MFPKILFILFLVFGCALAGSIHYGGGRDLSYGSNAGAYGGNGLILGGALTSGLYNGGYSHPPIGPLPAAVHSRRSYEVIKVQTIEEPAQLTQVDVDAVENPVRIRFVSKSSPVSIDQIHIPGEPGRHEETHSEDEPHRLVHTVTRPVIQEIREVIQPYRRVQQVVQPVVEEINTVVARGVPRTKAVVESHAPVVAVGSPVTAIAAPVTAIEVPTGVLVDGTSGLTHGNGFTLSGGSHLSGLAIKGSLY